MNGSYQLEWGPGGFLSSLDAAVRYAATERLTASVSAMTFQQIEEYLFNQRHPWTLLLVTRDPDLVKRCDRTIQLGECHLGPARPPTTP